LRLDGKRGEEDHTIALIQPAHDLRVVEVALAELNDLGMVSGALCDENETAARTLPKRTELRRRLQLTTTALASLRALIVFTP